MNPAGLTDSLAGIDPTPHECPHCHSASRIVQGLCLGCLLGSAVTTEEDGPDEFDQALAAIPVADTHWRLGNYEILEEIGRGGMGVIYRARQRHSRRIVALKRVLSYHADSRETLARFRREAEAAASLDHPNILPIYEVGESDDGVPYFSMKYASGGSLLEVGPALFPDRRRIVSLIAKVSRAAQHAHRQGILHRDLKPGNILLDGHGEPMVSDFGLAKWLDTFTNLTRTLTIFGTPGYIAPEQAEGRATDLTPAADVYSLGAILFGLLAGRPPFLGDHALAVIRQAADKEAPKLRSLVKGADKDLETICARCLERDPAARYRSAADLADDLERWLEGRPIIARPVSPPVRLWRWTRRKPALAGSIAATFLVIALAIGRQLQTRQLAAIVRENELAAHSIAVLPFLNLDSCKIDTAIAEALAKVFSTKLGELGPARVIALTDSTAERPGVGNLADLRQIAQTGVRTAMIGTTRTLGNKRRISLHLENTTTGETLLTEVIDADGTALPAENIADLARKIFAILTTARPITHENDPGVRNPRANEFLRAGDELKNRRTVSEIEDALNCYRRAIELEPGSAVARASFVLAAVQKQSLGAEDVKLLAKAEEYGREAVTLNDGLSDSHRALSALLFTQGKLSEAREEALRTIEAGGLWDGPFTLWTIDKLRGRPDRALRWALITSRWNTRPSESEFLIGDCLADLGEDEKAEAAYRRVSELYPEIPEGWIGKCRLKMLKGDFAAAREIYRTNLQRYQDYAFSEQMAAQVEFFSRNFTEAENLYRKLAAQDPHGGGSFYGCTSYQSVLGRIEQLRAEKGAEVTLKKCLTLEKAALVRIPDHPEILYRVAAIEASLGESESSLAHLKQAFAAGWLDYRSLARDPRFDRLHSDPNLAQLSMAMRLTVERLARTVQDDLASTKMERFQ